MKHTEPTISNHACHNSACIWAKATCSSPYVRPCAYLVTPVRGGWRNLQKCRKTVIKKGIFTILIWRSLAFLVSHGIWISQREDTKVYPLAFAIKAAGYILLKYTHNPICLREMRSCLEGTHFASVKSNSFNLPMWIWDYFFKAAGT